MQNSIEINVTAVLEKLVKKYRDKLNLVTWTSVEDRLPGEGFHVLAFDGAGVVVAFWNSLGWQTVRGWGYVHPTHWMPLPELPGENGTKLPDARPPTDSQKILKP